MSRNEIELTPAIHAVRKRPINLDKKDESAFAKEFEHFIPGCRKIKSDLGLVFYDGTVVDLGKLKKLSENSVHADLHFYISQIRKKKARLLVSDKRLLIVHQKWHQTYFHWVTDILPKLQLLHDQLNEYCVVLPQSDNQYQVESLKAFRPLETAALARDSFYFAKRFDYITPVAPTGNYNKHLITSLRERYLQYYMPDIGTKRRIYVSRSKSECRKVCNETELAILLEKFNIEVVHFENYSFAEQVCIAAQSEILIGMHGSGLTNMIFMHPNAHVVEIRAEGDNSNLCYFSLASDLDLNYWYNFSSTANEGFKVDLAQISGIIRNILTSTDK